MTAASQMVTLGLKDAGYEYVNSECALFNMFVFCSVLYFLGV